MSTHNAEQAKSASQIVAEARQTVRVTEDENDHLVTRLCKMRS